MRALGSAIVALAACGSSPPAADTNDPEAVVRAVAAAIERGDARALRATWPTAAELAPLLDCAPAMTATFDEAAAAFANLGDVKAMKGKKAELVKLSPPVIKEVPVGPFEGNCRVTRAFALAGLTARWKLEGEEHTSELVVIRIAPNRWRTFDVPGM